jgi:aminoglycoside phosphotransferase (APT) family kinase protein
MFLYSQQVAQTPPPRSTPDRELVGATASWLAQNIPGAQPPFRFEPVPGGSSNPTFFVSDRDGASWVLRRPPAHGRLAKAHDMAREFLVLTELSRAGLPVPTPIAFCEAAEVMEVPFYVMERVDGMVLRTREDILQLLDAPSRRRVALELIETLARIHRLEPDAIGLGHLGKRQGYLERQLRRWSIQAAASAVSSGVPQPALADLHARLVKSRPPDVPAAIVHGDFRLGNLVVAVDGGLLAVLDWELCTLGDPLADAAHTLVSWIEYGAPLPDGLPRARELATIYLEQWGNRNQDLGYHIAFAAWRFACILAGVHARYLSGAGAGDQVDLEVHLARIAWLADLSTHALEGAAFEGVSAPR